VEFHTLEVQEIPLAQVHHKVVTVEQDLLVRVMVLLVEAVVLAR
jgi:hypothetical protein